MYCKRTILLDRKHVDWIERITRALARIEKALRRNTSSNPREERRVQKERGARLRSYLRERLRCRRGHRRRDACKQVCLICTQIMYETLLHKTTRRLQTTTRQYTNLIIRTVRTHLLLEHHGRRPCDAGVAA